MMYQSWNDLPKKIVSHRDQFIDFLHKSIYSSPNDTDPHWKSFENIL